MLFLANLSGKAFQSVAAKPMGQDQGDDDPATVKAADKVALATTGTRVPDAYRGEVPRAYVTLSNDADITSEAFYNWLNARLGKHERVDAVVIRDTLPKTMIGKLDRKALRAEIAAEA